MKWTITKYKAKCKLGDDFRLSVTPGSFGRNYSDMFLFYKSKIILAGVIKQGNLEKAVKIAERKTIKFLNKLGESINNLGEIK